MILELLRRRGGRKQSFFTARASLRPSPVSYRAKARLLVGREGGSVRAEGFGRSVRAPAPPEPFFFGRGETVDEDAVGPRREH